MQKELLEDITYKKLTLNNVENNIIKNMEQNNMTESYNLIEILNKILENDSYNNIAKYLNVAVGTVKRWSELNNIPKQYTFDLFKLAKINIDYSKFSYKEKDQFFTPADTSKYCYQKFIEIITGKGDDKNNYIFVEPSAGNGVFLKLLPILSRIGLDIEPKFDEILEQDFLDWQPSEDKKYIVIGNPPFGLRGQLALKFINHASEFADYVCFILPQLFESDGKGVPRKRVIGLNLIYSEKLDSKFELPDGKIINVECIFQIWSKFHKDKKYDIIEENNTKIKIYSLSDGGTPSTTRNKKMFNLCDAYLPSTCFGKDNMKYYDSFEALPGRKGYGVVFNKDKEFNIKKFKSIEWHNVAFLSTNSAYNLRSSQITNQFK